VYIIKGFAHSTPNQTFVKTKITILNKSANKKFQKLDIASVTRFNALNLSFWTSD